MKTLQVSTGRSPNKQVTIVTVFGKEEDSLIPGMARWALSIAGYPDGQVWELGEKLPRRGYRITSSGKAIRLPDMDGWD